MLSTIKHLHTALASIVVCWQVLAEQARRVGISIEAENAVQQSAARAAVSRKKQDAGYSLEISSIHRRSVHELMFAHVSSHAV